MQNVDKGRKPLASFELGESDKLPLILSIFLFFLFSTLVLNHAFFFTMDADEAFNATIAKNWVAGYGYSSSLGLIFPFDAYISSGPAYTFLQAIPIFIFGNNPDLQKPFIALVHLVLFANILRLLRPHVASPSSFLCLVAFSLSSYALLDFKFWHRPAGELLSFLYFLNGALFLTSALFSRRYSAALSAGFFLACACLTKGQALLWVGGLLMVIPLYILRHPSAVLFRLLLVFATVFLIPILCWHWYKESVLAEIAMTDPALYKYAMGKDWHFFSTHGSGLYLMWEVESLSDLLRRFGSTPLLAFKKIQEIFRSYGVFNIGLSFLLPVVVICILLSSFRKKNEWLAFLVFPVFIFFLWVFFFNNSVYSHQILPGIWFCVILLGVWLSAAPRLVFFLAIVNFGVLVFQGVNNNSASCLAGRDASCVHVSPNPVRQSLKDVISLIRSRDFPAPIVNCGWYFAQDIEFSLPAVNNIQDCMRLFDSAVMFDRDAFISINHLPEKYRESRSTEELISIYVSKRKNLFGASFVAPVKWQRPIEFTFVAGPYMKGAGLESQRNVMSFLDHCHQTLYEDDYYSVRHCSFQDLQAYVKSWGGLPIFTHDWEAHYYADFMHTTKELRKSPLHMRPN